ncbi:NADPH-dependent F420 reductase [Haloarchaeobius sp. DYHT-AS-18]|uniref:NADPH-dependent F420 reductase n=1 Tax=Haloarchaeobius sp. DYHT-AS-18 TaxID=3446117 RepID=UPI003EBA12E2
MRIAILGGTGDIGEGLALRIAADTDHTVVIGSREAEKGVDAATEYESSLAARGIDASFTGCANADAVTDADVVILAVPPYYVGDTVDSIADQLGEEQIVVSPAVGMRGDEDGLHYHPPDVGSVTELIAERVSEDITVTGAFHNLSAGRLADLDIVLDIDTLVVGDDDDAKATVIALANEIDGLRALDAGPLANAPEVESVTPLVINIAKNNADLEHVGVKFQ